MRLATPNLLKNATREDIIVHSLKLSYYAAINIFYVKKFQIINICYITTYQCNEPLLRRLHVWVISDRHEQKFNSPHKFNEVTNITFPNYSIKEIMSRF